MFYKKKIIEELSRKYTNILENFLHIQNIKDIFLIKMIHYLKKVSEHVN